MSKRTRLFVLVASASLVAGVGTAAVASYVGLEKLGLVQGSADDDLAFVPDSAQLIAYADVRRLMDSELRQKIRPALESAARPSLTLEAIGLNLETDVDSLTVASLASPTPGATTSSPASVTEHSLAIARGRFDTTRIEATLRNDGAVVDEYRGTRLVTKDGRTVAFVQTGLVIAGHANAVRLALDTKAAGSGSVRQDEGLMQQLRRVDDGNAWMVAQFESLQATKALPIPMAGQLPAISWVAASGQVTSGLTARLFVEGRDDTAASDLREVVRGFVALARLQTGAQAEFAQLLDSIELTGDGRTVAVKFTVPGEFFERFSGTSARRAPLAPATPKPGVAVRVPGRPAA